ncbi:hypothetical protein KR026_009972 [Drosophila bipectinata]|nr:hypothetical protein KR026_009972 [Drosophila bipectinata]
MENSEIEFNDDYEHPDNVEYILESVLMPSDGSQEYNLLAEEYNSILLNQCRCNTEACENIETCTHGGQYELKPQEKELTLNKLKLNTVRPIIECNDLCGCSKNSCLNRLVQYGPRKNLEVFLSPKYRSHGLRTKVNIPSGAFICEYAGELLTVSEAKKRLENNQRLGLMNYILVLNEYSNEKKQQVTIVEPSRRGNIGRYLNHSCDPNCQIGAVRIDCPIPKLGIFAARDIVAQEELCFHYGGEGQSININEGKACLCAAANCTGFMPNTSIE